MLIENYSSWFLTPQYWNAQCSAGPKNEWIQCKTEFHCGAIEHQEKEQNSVRNATTKHMKCKAIDGIFSETWATPTNFDHKRPHLGDCCMACPIVPTLYLDQIQLNCCIVSSGFILVYYCIVLLARVLLLHCHTIYNQPTTEPRLCWPSYWTYTKKKNEHTTWWSPRIMYVNIDVNLWIIICYANISNFSNNF